MNCLQKESLLLVLCVGLSLVAKGQPAFSVPHGIYDDPVIVTLSGSEGAEIHYTTDGSTPTAASPLYEAPLQLETTTVLRAVEVSEGSLSPVTTSTYIFPQSVLLQSNTPDGYPEQWGKYTQIDGVATADYEMDPEMTADPVLSKQVIAGLKQLPVISLVSDPGNFFSHENDPERGGIYIFTGPPVGDATGHGWTRPGSAELFGGPQQHDLTIDCGIRLHGGHGRLAEKNPKHSFRLVFKNEYGPKSLKYPVFGADGPDKFQQLVLRCHFGNSWQHWSETHRKKAQFTRDVWARRMQRKFGRTSVDALYVNLFLNGMYWGVYNIAERIDDQFGKNHLGGNKDAIDVVRIEEDNHSRIEASEGTLDAWQLMVSLASQATDDQCYQQLQDSLLDIDAFIDYMLINQYAGNNDWAHHNWYAVRRHNDADYTSTGFQFICWDSEQIFESVRDNGLTKDNGKSTPTGIFQNLMNRDDFARRYLRRAEKLLDQDGLLGQASVVEVWDSLYNTISKALYAEAARWGDYRRDVHRWQTAGKLYTVGDTYLTERRRLLNDYFPYRSDNVLQFIHDFTSVQSFEAPADWLAFTTSLFFRWEGTGVDAHALQAANDVSVILGNNVESGGVVAGKVSVDYDLFADVSDYDRLVIRGKGSGLRILANRLVNHGPWKQVVVSFNDSDPYWNPELEAIDIPLSVFRTRVTTDGEERLDDFVHINAMKVDFGRDNSANVSGIWLVPFDPDGIAASTRHQEPNTIYDLQGRKISASSVLPPGIYIVNGRKVVVK